MAASKAGSARVHHLHYTLEDYLAFEASTDAKHEYLDGAIYAMAGGTPEHAALASAAHWAALRAAAEGEMHSGHLRFAGFRIEATGLLTYPDVSVVCGPVKRDAADPNSATNPTLILEVLSRSTEEYDRTEKFEHYQELSSLRAYVLVSH